MLTGILSYICLSYLIMTIKIHKEGNDFYSKTESLVSAHNEKLKEQLNQHKISPLKYKQSLLEIRKERKTTVVVNYIIAPILSPLIFLGYLLELVSNLIETVKYWNL